MKTFLLVFTIALIFSCKTETKTAPVEEPAIKNTTEKPVEPVKEVASKAMPKKGPTTAPGKAQKKSFPEALVKVFDAHGGLQNWQAMASLTYTEVKKDSKSVTTTDLITRQTVIDMPNHILGYDGKDVWVKNKNEKKLKKNPRFLYNLAFYFYAMPFLLADDGIIYSEAKPLVFDGKSYPGIWISYKAGIGESAKDEYVIYYNPETFRMEWLGYTVTFFSKEKSKTLKFRQYKDWQIVDGLLLPTTMVSYKSVNNLPTEKRGESKYENVKLSKTKPNSSVFAIQKGAEIAK